MACEQALKEAFFFVYPTKEFVLGEVDGNYVPIVSSN